jgi:hypothetical protein
MGGKDVDEFIKTKVLPEYRDIALRVRDLMRECAPSAWEGISYGIPVWKGMRALAVMNPTKKGITFAFSQGAKFEDKYGLLEGEGKISKNVRMKSLDELNEETLRYYITQALKLDEEK